MPNYYGHPPVVIDSSTPISVSGTIGVNNFPATQPITGGVTVNNFPATQPISGAVTVNNFPATQPVSGTVTVSNFPATQPISGTVTSMPYQTSTATVTTTASITTSSVQIVATNPNRKAFFIWNNSSNSVYLTFGPTSSSATPTVILATFATFSMMGPVCWTGVISGIRNAGTGTVTTYELV